MWSESMRESDLCSTKRKKSRPSPSSRPLLWELSEWSDTLRPSRDSDPSLPSGVDPWVMPSREDYTRTGTILREKLLPNIKRNSRPTLSIPKFKRTELPNTAQPSDSSVTLSQRNWTWKSKRPTFMKFRSTEEISNRRLTLDSLYSRRKSQLIKSSRTLRSSTLLVPPRDTDSPESSRDSVSENFQEKPTEDWERSDVSDLGILLEFSGPLPDAVSWVITKEQKWTRKSTELEKEATPLTPLQSSIWPKRISTQWEDLFIMEPSRMISLWSEDAVLVLRRDLWSSERLFIQELADRI